MNKLFPFLNKTLSQENFSDESKLENLHSITSKATSEAQISETISKPLNDAVFSYCTYGKSNELKELLSSLSPQNAVKVCNSTGWLKIDDKDYLVTPLMVADYETSSILLGFGADVQASVSVDPTKWIRESSTIAELSQ